MNDPITRDEEYRMPRNIMARHLSDLRPPLSDSEREELLDTGLVMEHELEEVPADDGSGDGGTRWTYVGERWGVTSSAGRPVLVAASDAPIGPLTAMQDVERRFAGAVLLIELMFGGPTPDEEVARLRSDGPWRTAFDRAQQEDAQRGARCLT